MTRKTLTAFAVIAIGMTMLLLASCSFLIPNTIKITNMSAASVTITCEDFIDGTSCTIPAYGSVTKTVTAGKDSIFVYKKGMYYQSKEFETIKLNASGIATLTPDTAWIRLVNNSGKTITSASIDDHYFYQYQDESCEEIDSSSITTEGWLMVSNFNVVRIKYTVNYNEYNYVLPYRLPSNGEYLLLSIGKDYTVSSPNG